MVDRSVRGHDVSPYEAGTLAAAEIARREAEAAWRNAEEARRRDQAFADGLSQAARAGARASNRPAGPASARSTLARAKPTTSPKAITPPRHAALNGKWFLVGATGGGAWAFSQLDGGDKWWAIGLVALVSGFIFGKLYRLVLALALIAAAALGYAWYMNTHAS